MMPIRPSITIELDKGLSEKDRQKVIEKIRKVKGVVSLQEVFNPISSATLIHVKPVPPANIDKFMKIKGVSRAWSKSV